MVRGGERNVCVCALIESGALIIFHSIKLNAASYLQMHRHLYSGYISLFSRSRCSYLGYNRKNVERKNVNEVEAEKRINSSVHVFYSSVLYRRLWRYTASA